MLRHTSRSARRGRVVPISNKGAPPEPPKRATAEFPSATTAGSWGPVPDVAARTEALEEDPMWRLTDEGLARPVTTPFWIAGLVFGLPFVVLVVLGYLLR